MTSATVGRAFVGCHLSLLLLLAVGCSTEPDAIREIQAGQTRDEVTAAAGNPYEIIEFTLPDGPFFGPQEGLANLLPAGTLVEEWQYKAGGDVTYVWFASGAGEPQESWTVIDTGVYPADAVY